MMMKRVALIVAVLLLLVVELACNSASFKMQLTATALEKFYPDVELCCVEGAALMLDQSATAATNATVRWHYE